MSRIELKWDWVEVDGSDLPGLEVGPFVFAVRRAPAGAPHRTEVSVYLVETLRLGVAREIVILPASSPEAGAEAASRWLQGHLDSMLVGLKPHRVRRALGSSRKAQRFQAEKGGGRRRKT